MVAPLREQFLSITDTVTEFNTVEENIVAVITQDRLIDDNLKTQIKNQTFLYL